jgi:hypothetical protein
LFASSFISRRRFLLYNMIAAYALVPILYLDKNYPVFVLEVIWGSISAFGYARLRFLDQSEQPVEQPAPVPAP